MLRHLRSSVLMLVWMTVATGGVYPALVTVAARLIFPGKAEGSLIHREGRIAGSELIGQPFQDAKYFWSRPSATTPGPYNGGASTGSNLGPTNPELEKAIRERIAALRAADPGQGAPIPVDLVTASGSGLDPDISPAAALWQAPRVARARNLSEEAVRDLVLRQTRTRDLFFLGEPRVNVLRLNLALEDLQGRAR
jgi:potassium-transporting ATPase KdpC subunit